MLSLEEFEKRINCELRCLKLVNTSSRSKRFIIKPLSIPVVFKHVTAAFIPDRKLPVYRLNPEVPVDAFYGRDKVERGDYPRENYLVLMTVDYFERLLKLLDELSQLRKLLEELSCNISRLLETMKHVASPEAVVG